MFVLLQNDRSTMKIEYEIINDILKRTKYLHEYLPISLNDFLLDGELGKPENYLKSWENAVPIGTIDFVQSWLKIYHNISMHPIEVPMCLRTQEFLKREYKIVKFEDIPKSGEWFVKDVSQLKVFSTGICKDISKIDFAVFSDERKNHLYQVSEYLDILSEYRAYFINGKLVNVCQYNGDFCHYPDIPLIEKANLIYSLQKDYPNSYTMDLMVSERGTSIIEIHPFAAIGFYGTLWPDSIIYAYKDGLDYYVKHNTKVAIT